jgi:hypothetical protein
MAVNLGAPLISLIVITQVLTDPVNLPKYFVLVSLGISLLIVISAASWRQILSEHKAVFIFIFAFVLISLNSIFWSDSPFTQNIYGVYGRNSGFLTYLSLSAFLLAALTFKNLENYRKLLLGFFVTGAVNVIYCAWVVLFGDFIGWNNEYGNILGLLGNPNFIGAFLGMFSTFLLALIVRKESRLSLRVVLVLMLLVSFAEIQASHAIQGKVVAGVGFSVVIFLYLRTKFNQLVWSRIFLALVGVIGSFSIAGALQVGPLARFIYKNSVSLRGSYWDAGLEMGIRFPFTGVGMDSYIEWYRQLRSINAATRMPGPDIVTNAAHNVPIDIFSYGGFPLLCAYLGVMFFGARAAVWIIRNMKSFDYIAVSLIAVWLGYQVQSVVSINQVGLAIWGWVFTGSLISYQKYMQSLTGSEITEARALKTSKSVYKNTIISSSLVGGVGILVGGIIALPPYNADLKWRSALLSQSLEKVEIALTPSIFNPPNSSKYLQAYTVFVDSKLPEQARKYTLEFIKFNPRSFEAWKCLYSLASSSELEKRKALTMMKSLDPNNPDVTALR